MQPTNRQALFIISFISFALVGFALYLQHSLEMRPCPLCVIQRYFFLGIGLAALWLWLSERATAGVDAARRAVFERRPGAAVRPSWRMAPVLVIALIPLLANWS